MRFSLILIVAFALLFSAATAFCAHRVLFIDSYHGGYAWSDGITTGVKNGLNGQDVILKIHRMDTKRNPGDAFKVRAAAQAKEAIEAFQPHVVIASDDNASKYLIMKYYKEAHIPFVFCGVNYTAEAYGFPCSNVTGMVEVPPVIKLIYSLKHFSRVVRVGYLASDTLTERKDGEYAKRDIREAYIERYVKTFAQWKDAFVDLQGKVDVLIVGNNAGIKGWNDGAAERFALANTSIPTGCLLDWMTPVAFLGATRKAEEQGSYAAMTALKILDGASAGQIPIVRNTQADIIINMKIAKKLGLKVPNSFMKIASKIIE
jgi:ABC-type uncharacterized transport system substrate-binding protein